ncbi:proliferation differentiation and control 1-like [Octopus vulgaris]|uniref:Proliferation differentiation and control 1-like n=1 Tax=Octopus vulgaris TaxID=6645 RepID=A0AA36EYP5_OCTVU|nr:proliferation differentiation and control 1-like [Octopus vulgaris]
MIALEKANGEMKHDASDDESEDDNEEGDYTVYECPGLAPTGEMEVKNPLFSDESSTFPRTNSLGNGSAVHQLPKRKTIVAWSPLRIIILQSSSLTCDPRHRLVIREE